MNKISKTAEYEKRIELIMALSETGLHTIDEYAEVACCSCGYVSSALVRLGIPYRKKATGSTIETLCLSCAKCYGGCSWTKNFIPVENWTAEKTTIGDIKAESFQVSECPIYERNVISDGREILLQIYDKIDKTISKAVRLYINTEMLSLIVKGITLRELTDLMQLEIISGDNIVNFRLEYEDDK